MAKKTHDVLADLGTYVGADGQEKKRWLKIGALFDSMSLKLDVIPITPEWSGWLVCKEPTPFEPQQRPAPQQRPFDENDPPF